MMVGLKRFRLATVLATALIASVSAAAQETPRTPDISEPSDPPETAEVPVPEIDNDATNSLPPTPVQEGHPCQVRDNDQLSAWIDRVHSSLYRITCSSSTWFDSLFGSGRYDQEYRATNGNVTLGALWSQRDGVGKLVRFRARMYFPRLSDRFHAFIGRVDPDEFVTESKNDIYGLPRAFDRNLNDSVLLGLGYNEPLQKGGSFDADTGVHLQFPLDPYVKGSYRYARPISERDLLHIRETLFWENIEGFGTTARADLDHVISDHYLLRWSSSGTFSEKSEGLRWNSGITLYHVVSTTKQSTFAYETTISGSTQSEVPLTDYGVNVFYRQSVWRTWLMLQLRTGIDWPRYSLSESRHSNLSAGLAFEMNYGRK